MRRLDLFGGSYGHARIVLLARNRSGHPAAITFYVCPAQAFGKRTAGNNGCSGMLLDRRPCVPNNALAAMTGEE